MKGSPVRVRASALGWFAGTSSALATLPRGVGMLLCLSSRQRRVFEEPVEVSGEVALEAAGGLAAAFAFLDSTLDVVDGRSVGSASGNDDLVECSVELSVAAAVEPVADRLAGGRDRGGAGESRECAGCTYSVSLQINQIVHAAEFVYPTRSPASATANSPN